MGKRSCLDDEPEVGFTSMIFGMMKHSTLKEHDSVIVPDPIDGDLHDHSFVGTIIHIYTNETHAVVEDQENNVYTIEIDRLTLNEE
jgi:hypothetical protein